MLESKLNGRSKKGWVPYTDMSALALAVVRSEGMTTGR